MEVTSEVCNILKCSKCSMLLSCGPVYLFITTQNVICGRCQFLTRNDNSNNEPICRDSNLLKVRYIQYEAAASLLLFPCRYEKYGCTQKMRFSAEGPDSHEISCKFKPYSCPMNPSSSCSWQDRLDKLLEHCEKAHPQQISENPCCYPPKWNLSNDRTFLITFMDLIFLLHVKVNLQQGKIFHSVRLLGDPALARGLQFTFKAKKNTIEYSKEGDILSAGRLTMEENSAITTPINNLLEILDGNFERSVFTIIISVVMVNCKYCRAKMEFSLAKICSECLIKIRKCERNSEGCTYEDVNKYKCYKHEYYYRKYRTKCSFRICYKTFAPGCFFQHFKETPCRPVINSKVGEFWHADHANKYCVLDSYIGPILCRYYMKCSNLNLYAYTSLPSNELEFFHFVVQIRDTVFCQLTKTEIAEVVKNDQHDFMLIFHLKDFSSWKSNGVNINIKINSILSKS